MNAWLLDRFDGIEHLRLAEVEAPRAGEGEAVLEVRYAALNPADRYLAEAQYPARPVLAHVLGRDGLGTVLEVGPGVSDVKVGDVRAVLRSEVGVSRWGTFAERVAVPADALVPVPDGWTDEEAAGATLVYITAWQALTQWNSTEGGAAPVVDQRGNSGWVVLITGGSGGMGVASLQLAKAMGFMVISLSRSEQKRAKLREMGADACFDPNDTQWRRRVKELLGERRVDLAIDNIGGPLFNEVLDVLGMWGKLSVVGRLAGLVPQFNPSSLFFRRLRIGGVAASTYTRTEARAAWEASVEMLQRTGAKPVVDRVFGFEEVPQAFERLAQGPMGKVLVRVVTH
jgi:NADPH:quinone reductase